MTTHPQTRLPRRAVAAAGVCAALCSVLAHLGRPAWAAAPSPATAPGARLARAPIYFEANTGQTDRHVAFLSRGIAYTLFLTPTGTVIKLVEAPQPGGQNHGTLPPNGVKRPAQRIRPQRARRSAAVRISFEGGNPSPKMEGLDALKGHANYFLGNDPTKWQSAVPTYARVRYRRVWPGIDVVYYGSGDALEYDLIVAPGADPSAIRFGVEGAGVKIDSTGDIVLDTAAGRLGLCRPRLYQDGQDGVQHPIEGRFVTTAAADRGAKDTIAVAVADYDRSRPLVIDPQLVPQIVYSTYFGGSGGLSLSAAGVGDQATEIALDSANNVYVTGIAYSTDFPTTTGPASDPGSLFDTPVAFVAKLNLSASGAASLVYSTYLGGHGGPDRTGIEGDEALGIAVDGSGDAYITGFTFSNDFPTSAGAFQSTNPHSDPNIDTAFVTELDPSGSQLVYSTYLGGNGGTPGNGITGDEASRVALMPGCVSNCEAYIAGLTTSGNFPMQNPYQGKFPEPNDRSAAFVSVVAADGGSLVYSTYLGGTNGSDRGGDGALGIAVDSSGNAYATGFADSGDFPVVGGFQNHNRAFVTDEENAFIAKLDPKPPGGTGSLIYSSFLGGSGTPANPGDFGYEVAVDSAGHAFVGGLASSSDFPTTKGAFQRANRAAPHGGVNAFATEVQTNGSSILYSTLLGGTGGPFPIGDSSDDLAIDSHGHIYVTGSATSPDFPTTPGACQTRIQSQQRPPVNAFITELDPAAKSPNAQLVFSTYFGGTVSDNGAGIAVAGSGNIYIVGGSQSPDLPITPDSAFQTGENALGRHETNAFVAEIDPSGGCPRMSVGPTVVNFANAGIGAPAVGGSFTIRNTGNSPLEGTVASLLPPFRVMNPGPFSVDAGKPMTVNLQFEPSSIGVFHNALTIVTNDSAHPSVPIKVAGTGLPGVMTLKPKALAFGSVPVNTTSKPGKLLIKNTGLGVLNVNVNVGGVKSPFKALSAGGDLPPLSAGQAAEVDVLFTPTSKGVQYTAILVTPTNSPLQKPVLVPISGKGR